MFSGKREKITITNNKDRLSQEEIERLVQEAEEYAEEDKKAAGKVSARNSLETYVYNLKNQIGDKLGEKMDPSDKEKVSSPCSVPQLHPSLGQETHGKMRTRRSLAMVL